MIKKLLGIMVLGLFWCNIAFSDNLPVKLFGIKIKDDASNYVDISKGKISEKRPGVISYYESEDIEIKGLIKNSKLDGYYIRTDKDNKIMIVAAYASFEDMWSKDFKNECSDLKIDFIKSLSNYYDFNAKKIQNNYYKSLFNNLLFLLDSAELNYNKNFNKFTLQIMCRYTNYNELVRSRLFISLMNQNYFKNNTLPLWEKISKFDDSVIKSNLSGF